MAVTSRRPSAPVTELEYSAFYKTKDELPSKPLIMNPWTLKHNISIMIMDPWTPEHNMSSTSMGPGTLEHNMSSMIIYPGTFKNNEDYDYAPWNL